MAQSSMYSESDKPVYSVFLYNGPDEIGVLISLAERQEAMDIVIRYHAREAKK